MSLPSEPQIQPARLPASGQRRDPALDGLRGVAALLVFLFHYGGGLRAHNPLLRTLGYITQAGWVGVDFFFALSGFLITGLLLDDLGAPHFLRNFYGRRALRILPLYLLALLLCAAAALVTGAPLSALKPLLIYLAFLQNIPSLLNTALHAPPPLPVHHLWSLAVEEQFYLVWPFLLLAARTPRRVLLLCLGTFALSCLCRLLLFSVGGLSIETAANFAVILPVRAGALALGGAFAAYSRHTVSSAAESSQWSELQTHRQLRRPVLLLAASAALAVVLLVGTFTHSLLLNSGLAYTLGLPAVDVLAAVVVALSLSPGLFRSLLSAPALAFLGRISYGFYVFHILMEPLFDHLGKLLTGSTSGFGYQAARLLCALPITIGTAWLSFTFWEQPFLRLKARLPRHRSSTASAVPS